MTVTRGNRPSIAGVGHVTVTADQVVITGWALGQCAAQCPCHRHPTSGQLVIFEDQKRGILGLASYPPQVCPAPPPCTCCQPWQWWELASVIRDLASVQSLPTTPPAAPATS